MSNAPPANLSAILDDIEARLNDADNPRDSLALGEILRSVGRRSYGPLLLVIGLFAISPATIVPGFTWLAAALTLVVAGQLALGLSRVWLPAAALGASVPRDKLRQGLDAGRPWARRIDAVLKPRLVFLTAPPFVNLVGLLCLAAALLTFPLGLIPFAPLAPGLAIVTFGLGIVARDGLWIMLGAAGSVAAGWIVWPLFF